MITPRSRSAVRRFLLVVLACGAWLTPAAHAAPAAVTLRYHFVAGQVLTYLQTTTEDTRVVAPGRPDDVQHAVVTYQSHYLFRHVDAAGNATLTITFSPGKEISRHNGKVSYKTVPAAQMSSPTNACLQEADGTQFCAYRGAYGENDIGQAPVGPVASGASWKSHIDNTWDVSGRKPVTVKNVLQQITTGPQGPTAVISATATIPVPAATSSAILTTPTLLRAREAGTWSFAVAGGIFLSETLRQTSVADIVVKDAQGTHPATGTDVSTITMQLVSVHATTPRPFQPAGPTKTYHSASYGYALTYPTAWQPRPGTAGGFQVSTADGNGAVFVAVVPGAPISTANLTLLPRFISSIGTPEGPVSTSLETIHGQQFGVADALVKTKSNYELQVEVRDTATPLELVLAVGVVGSGTTDGSLRLPTFAQQVEQVQRILDSFHTTGGNGLSNSNSL